MVQSKTETPRYTVIYRTGGYANAEWHKVLGIFTWSEATEKVAEIEKAGRKALIHDAKQLEAIGMPVGHCTDRSCKCGGIA